MPEERAAADEHMPRAVSLGMVARFFQVQIVRISLQASDRRPAPAA